jgi:transcriptional regulator with XRE-family HTH domain
MRIEITGDLADLTTAVQVMIGSTGLTQKSLAQSLGISEKHLSQIKAGRVSLTLHQLHRISELCGYRITLTAERSDHV